MQFTRRAALLLLAGSVSAASLASIASAGGQVVQISLWDKGAMSMDMMGKTHPMGMAMMGADMTMATMGITADQTTIPAGEVTFEVRNDSKDLIHEMVISPVGDPTVVLPYIQDEERVDEDAAVHLGEVAELEAGASGALTISLKPGTYILYCNIPGHYVMGMWTTITVTG